VNTNFNLSQKLDAVLWDKNMNPDTSISIISEQEMWERLRDISIRKGGNPPPCIPLSGLGSLLPGQKAVAQPR